MPGKVAGPGRQPLGSNSLRPLRAQADAALRDMRARFNQLCAKTGRPSCAPGGTSPHHQQHATLHQLLFK